MSVITGLTRGGVEWIPAFITDLNQGTCIGCGRCFKVCPRDVFELVEREGLDAVDESDDDDYYDDEDDGFSDDTSMVMNLKNAMDCIGCEACSRVCPKNCLSHESAAAAA
jgi:Nif-specific ferredoxin III